MIKFPSLTRTYLGQRPFFLKSQGELSEINFHTVVVLIPKNIFTFKTDEICKKAFPFRKNSLEPVLFSLCIIYYVVDFL